MKKFTIGQPVQIVRRVRSAARLVDLGEPQGGFLEEVDAGDTVKTYWGGKIQGVRRSQGATIYTLVGRARFCEDRIAAPGELKRAQYYEDELEAVGELPIAASLAKAASHNK